MILLLYKYIHRVLNKTEYMVERTMQTCGIDFGLGIAETVGRRKHVRRTVIDKAW